MTVRTSVRFEVLKRDRFTCVYCGRSAPDVLLHIDHVIPESAGGTADLDNLVTACVDCNLGKSDRMLEEGSVARISDAAISDARARAEQLRAYRQWTTEIESELATLCDFVWEAWVVEFDGDVERADGRVKWTCDVHFPADSAVRRFVQALPLQAIIDAVHKAGWRFRNPSPDFGPMRRGDVRRYFYGICNRLVSESQASVKEERKRTFLGWKLHLEETPRGRGWVRIGDIIKRIEFREVWTEDAA